jgi:hypothetical protein
MTKFPPPPRRAILFGNTVEFQSRNMRLASVRWHTRLKEQYATEKDARVAAYVWEKKGIALLAQDFPKRQKAVLRGQQELFREGAPI